MAKDVRKDTYLNEFLERVREARKRHYRSQTLIADRMGLDQDKYKQYESRSFLPHYMIPLFCDLCHITADWLFTGQGERAMRSIPEAKQRPTKKPPTRQIKRVA